MQIAKPLSTKQCVGAAILAFFALVLRSSDDLTFVTAHEQLAPSPPLWSMEDRSVTSDSLLSATMVNHIAPIRGGNPGLSSRQISNPLAVRLLSYYMTPMNVRSLAVSGHYAYVGDGFALDVFDVSNPLLPTLVNVYTTGETAFGPGQMIISGTVLYASYEPADLRILDISQPMSPTLIGYYHGPGYAAYPAFVENYIYLATNGCGLSIIDVSELPNPTEVGCWNAVQSINAVASDEQYAYVAESQGSPGIAHILDVSNPISPTVLGSYPSPWPITSIASVGDYLYIANLQGFYIVDISTPSSPQGITFYPVNGCEDMLIMGDRMYMAVGVGVLILDVSDPVNPIQIGQGELPSSGTNVVVAGQYIYMTDVNVWDWGGYKILWRPWDI
jgi:hypothetical protein